MCLFWWLPLGVNTSRGRKVGPQVNKFEQVSSDYHQILAARGSGSRVPRSHVWEGDTLPCNLFNDAFDVICPRPYPEQKSSSENIAFPKLLLLAVTTLKQRRYIIVFLWSSLVTFRRFSLSSVFWHSQSYCLTTTQRSIYIYTCYYLLKLLRNKVVSQY